MTALYNENDPFAANWLQNLATHGHIAQGTVDRRSIADLTTADVAGPGQRHFFAGIGGWSHALRLAGVPDDADVWTGSCPCQPFSDAGTGSGTSDPRHLWPAWLPLISECRPPIIFGEQVASRDGLEWLDLVFADLERCGYAVGAADLCAAGVGAPHQRQRLYFVAYTHGEPGRLQLRARGPRDPDAQAERSREVGGMADAAGERVRGRGKRAPHGRTALKPPGHGDDSRMADTNGQRLEIVGKQQARRQRTATERGGETRIVGDASGSRGRRNAGAVHGKEGQGSRARRVPDVAIPAGATSGYWSPADWILCRDPHGGPPVARPVEPGTFPLAHGVAGRVGLLRGYGNAIVTYAAAAFVRAAVEAISGLDTVMADAQDERRGA